MINYLDRISYDFPFALVFVFLLFLSLGLLVRPLFLIVSLFILVLTFFVYWRLFVVLLIFLALFFLFDNIRNTKYFCPSFTKGVVEDVKLGRTLSFIIKTNKCKLYLFASKRYNNVKIGDIVYLKVKLRSVDRIKNKGFARYLRSLSIGWYGFASKIRVVGKKHPIADFEAEREKIEQEFYYFLPTRVEYFLDSAILGDNKYKSKVKTIFVNTQTAHIMAVSGLHMGFVFGLFYLLFFYILSNIGFVYRRYILKIAASLVAFVPVTAYFCMIGFHLPALRSFIMTVLFVFSLIFSRRKSSYNILFLIASIFVLLNHLVIFNPSFVMSFLMTFFALLVFGFVYSLKANKIVKTIVFMVLMSLVATPITSFYFSKISYISLIANLIVIPVFGFVVVPLAFAGIFASFIPYNPVKVYIFKFIGVLVGKFLSLVGFLAAMSHPIAYKMPLLYVFILYALFASVLFMGSKLLPRQDNQYQTLGRSSF